MSSPATREDDSARREASELAPAAEPFEIRAYLLATGLCRRARSAFGVVLDQVLDVRNLALVFLMAVLTSAVLHGLRPALYAAAF